MVWTVFWHEKNDPTNESSQKNFFEIVLADFITNITFLKGKNALKMVRWWVFDFLGFFQRGVENFFRPIGTGPRTIFGARVPLQLSFFDPKT